MPKRIAPPSRSARGIFERKKKEGTGSLYTRFNLQVTHTHTDHEDWPLKA
jgi:hypothetical protein